MCVHCLNHGEHGGRRGRGNCGGRGVHRLKLDNPPVSPLIRGQDSKDFQEWSTLVFFDIS